MRFEYYHADLDSVPKLSVDGIVPNSVHFSHWEGNQTPAQVKADTSTEIALKLVASPNRDKLTRGIELVTNNHFDTDGVLSVWTVLNGDRASKLRESLIAAAEAGDFSELSTENGVRASIAIQGSDNNDSGSPLAGYLNGAAVSDEAKAYDLVLPEVERLLTRIDEYEHLWREGWEQIAIAVDSFERGTSTVEELKDVNVSLVILAPEVFSPTGFNPTKHAAPFTAISRYAHGRLFIVTTPSKQGWSYRIDYPYYSWAETVARPLLARQDFTSLLAHLNELESSGQGAWKLDHSEMTSAVKFLDPTGVPGVSSLRPNEVAAHIRSELQNISRGFHG